MRFITALYFLRYSAFVFANANSPETIPYVYYLLSGQGEPDTTKSIDELYDEGQLKTDSLRSACIWHSTSGVPFLCNSGCPIDGFMWQHVLNYSNRSGLFSMDVLANIRTELPDFGSPCMTGSKSLCCRWDMHSMHYDGLWLDQISKQLASCVYYGPGDERIRYNSHCGTLKCKHDDIHMIINITGSPINNACDIVSLFAGFGIIHNGQIDFYAPDSSVSAQWIKLAVVP